MTKYLYGFAFLSSPSNPLPDSWMSDLYLFGYSAIQSESTSFFTFNPYSQVDGRIDKEGEFASLVPKTFRLYPTIYGDRTNQARFSEDMQTKLAVQRHMEAIHQQGFQDVLAQLAAFLMAVPDPVAFLQELEWGSPLGRPGHVINDYLKGYVRSPKEGGLHTLSEVFVDHTPQPGQMIISNHLLEQVEKTNSVIEAPRWIKKVDSLERRSLADFADQRSNDKMEREPSGAVISFVGNLFDSTLLNAKTQEDRSREMDKIKTNAFMNYVIGYALDRNEKASLISRNLKIFNRVVTDAYKIQEEAWAYKNKRGGYEGQEGSDIYHYLLASSLDLDAILIQMMKTDHGHDHIGIIDEVLEATRQNRHESHLEVDHLIENGAKESRLAAIEKLIIAMNEDRTSRPAYIPTSGYLLSGDNSDWENIWNLYSPGVDVIDVPNTDYDYSLLENRVFDPATGVPYQPLSPTNVPDVKVPLPLHHPLPSNYDLGTTEVTVDNNVMIDMILAIESLKNRSKLRYAGMPSERAMQDLFSKLFAWIQGSASDSDQYDRMFRFARWYGEMVVNQLCDHILRREYASWKSSIHSNGDLGIPYTQTGWQYYPNASVIQTISTDSLLTFEKTTFIDGQMTVDGYFDNPLGEGTMKVTIDGVESPGLGASDNGVFSLTFDMPAGDHTVEFHFYGASGRLSLSYVEITGATFVRAYTITDDSNTNGLKAATNLITQLIAYFDQHHANGKVKGTMQIKQRKLWQST